MLQGAANVLLLLLQTLFVGGLGNGRGAYGSAKSIVSIPRVGFPYAGRGFGILISCLISVCHHVTCVFEASVPLDNACAMSKSLDLLDSESDKN
jgi:hypothetical protein